MQIQIRLLDLALDKIKPDPKQPRQRIDKGRVSDMAKSMKTEGVINPIEVDQHHYIITGEMRWRAAREAGLKTIPCKVLTLTPDDRFRRQVIENIHHNTMSDWDTAKALTKLLAMGPRPPGSQPTDEGIHWLSKEIGKSFEFVRSHVKLLQSSKPLQKAVREEKIVFSQTRALQIVSPQFKKALEKKIIASQFQTRDGAIAVAAALNKNPDKAKKILGVDYSVFRNTADVVTKLSTIVPSVANQIQQSFTPSKQLAVIRKELVKWIEKNQKEDVGEVHRAQITATLSGMIAAIERWVK